jgi:tetratricopeptide (TPR) repeat protein
MTASRCRVSKGTVFRDLWRASIAHWSCLMANDRWFEAFLAERSEAYQRHLDEASVRQFRHELAMRFSDLVGSAGRTVKQIGMPTLGEEFARELQVARACRELPGGGLRLPQSSVPLACGPAMLRELGVIDALEENLAQWPAGDECVEGGTGWADPGVLDTRVLRLRRLFSSLGFAQARLEQGNPAGALESLRWVICAECAGKVTDRDPAHLAVCRSDCSQFANRNPGFRDCRDPSGELQRQGPWLRVQALVGAAEQVILLAEPDAEEARQHWHTLLRLVPDEAGNSRLQEHLLKRVELRIAGMHEEHLHRKAVQLIDAANECFRQPRRFEGILGQLLTDWGVETANDGHTFDAIEPLERALQLNPDIHRARTSLVRVLHCAAGKSADDEKFEQARAYLDQADAVTRAAGVGFAEADELREESTLASIEFCCRSWNDDYRRRDLDAAARNLEDGIRLANAPLSNPRHREQAEAMAQRLNEYLGLVCDAAARECVRGGDDAAARRWQARARN